MILSLFPGIDMLGRAFELEGFTVVRGPDLIYGGDARKFSLVSHTGSFCGIIGGPPCQDFSGARRCEPTGEGMELIGHYLRIVTEGQPEWWLMENVAGSPNVTQLGGYHIQQFTLNARECGMEQNRLRKFHFGFRDGKPLVIPRCDAPAAKSRCCMASEGSRGKSRRSWPEFCRLQGLPPDFALPGLSRGAQYRAVGNGVPIPMGRVIARAIVTRLAVAAWKECECGCGRLVHGKQIMATPACRKRMERRRHVTAGVSGPGTVTRAASQPQLFSEV